jgi:ABC-type cobalamin transport system ATPase subunit
MNRPRLKRSIRTPTGVSRAGVLAVTVAAAILANAATWTTALAQQRVPIAQQRDEAPIMHVQPRIQDLPPGVAQDEDKTQTELDDIAKQLEMIDKRICRGC